MNAYQRAIAHAIETEGQAIADHIHRMCDDVVRRGDNKTIPDPDHVRHHNQQEARNDFNHQRRWYTWPARRHLRYAYGTYTHTRYWHRTGLVTLHWRAGKFSHGSITYWCGPLASTAILTAQPPTHLTPCPRCFPNGHIPYTLTG